MTFVWLDLIKLLAALVAGGLIGAERERSRKAVGFRTLILIAMGSALFTMLSHKLAASSAISDPGRITANVVVGIGFLGAGVILEDRGRITGLTTAASIWLAAALGMAAGMGQFVLLAITTAISLVVLFVFRYFEPMLATSNEIRTYTITTTVDWSKYKALKSLFKEYGLTLEGHKQEKHGRQMVCTFEVSGSIKKHEKLTQKLLNDDEIKEFGWY